MGSKWVATARRSVRESGRGCVSPLFEVGVGVSGGAEEGDALGRVKSAATVASVVRDPRAVAGTVDDEPPEDVAVVELEEPVVPVLPEPSTAATHRRE